MQPYMHIKYSYIRKISVDIIIILNVICLDSIFYHCLQWDTRVIVVSVPF